MAGSFVPLVLLGFVEYERILVRINCLVIQNATKDLFGLLIFSLSSSFINSFHYFFCSYPRGTNLYWKPKVLLSLCRSQRVCQHSEAISLSSKSGPRYIDYLMALGQAEMQHR